MGVWKREAFEQLTDETRIKLPGPNDQCLVLMKHLTVKYGGRAVMICFFGPEHLSVLANVMAKAWLKLGQAAQ